MNKEEIAKTLEDSGLFLNPDNILRRDKISGNVFVVDAFGSLQLDGINGEVYGESKIGPWLTTDQSEEILSDIGLQVIKTKINSMELKLYVLAWVGKPMMVHSDPNELCAIKIADAFLTITNDGQGITQAQNEVIAKLTTHPEWFNRLKEHLKKD